MTQQLAHVGERPQRLMTLGMTSERGNGRDQSGRLGIGGLFQSTEGTVFQHDLGWATMEYMNARSTPTRLRQRRRTKTSLEQAK
jgi:hypothetical protein